MKSTALGAENIIFISDAHEKFYYEKLQEVRYQDVYHKALCYCLGINGDTRKNADRIYNFKTGSVKTKCLHGFILGLHFGGIVVSLLCDSFYLGTVVLNRLMAESS